MANSVAKLANFLSLKFSISVLLTVNPSLEIPKSCFVSGITIKLFSPFLILAEDVKLESYVMFRGALKRKKGLEVRE